MYSVGVAAEACPVYEPGPHNGAGAAAPTEDGYFEWASDDLRRT